MKIGKLLPLSILFIGLQVKAMDDAIPGSAGTINAQDQQSLQVVIENTPYIQAALKKCYDDPDPNTRNNISGCLWSEIERQGKVAEVNQLIEQARQARAQSSDELRLSGASQNTVSENAEDDIQKKAIKKLSEIYEKKLTEELKQDGSFLNVTSQDTFFELAKTQISKNIISTWSSVCINAGWAGNSLVIFQPQPNSSLYEQIRKKNIEALTSTRGGVDQDNNPVSSGDNLSRQFFLCAKHLKSLCQESQAGTIKCPTNNSENPAASNPAEQSLNTGQCTDLAMPSYDRNSYFQTPSGDNPSISLKSINKQANAVDVTANFEEIARKSRQKACEAYTYVDGLRRQLKATEKVVDILQADEQQKANETTPDGRKIIGSFRMDKVERRSGDVDIEKLTTITSADVAAEGSYYESIENDISIISRCRENPNDTQCAGILANTDAEKARIRNTGVALMLETESLKEKIGDAEKIAALDNEEKRRILKALRPNIDVDEVNLDAELLKVQESFLTQRTNLIASLSDRVKQLEMSSPNNDVGAEIDRVGKSTLRQGNDYIQMIHFNNVISGYFKTETGQQNTRVLDLELESVANLDNRALNTVEYGQNSELFNSSYKQNLQTGIRGANPDLQLGASENTQETLRLKADDLSQFIDYEVEP